MENIKLWQYIVIAGPSALLGGLFVWLINKDYIRGLEDLILHDKECGNAPCAKEIARRLLEGR